MQPGAQFDPVWLLSAAFTAFESILTLVLVMPMPSNKFRGSVVHALADLWHKNEYIKRTAWVLVALNCYYLWQCVSNLMTYNQVYAAGCDSRAMVLYLQRNTFISALSVLMFLVMRRLLDIQQQLFATRALVKEALGALGPSTAASRQQSGTLEPSALPHHPTAGAGATPAAAAAAGRGARGVSVHDMLRQLDRNVTMAMGHEADDSSSKAAQSKQE